MTGVAGKKNFEAEQAALELRLLDGLQAGPPASDMLSIASPMTMNVDSVTMPILAAIKGMSKWVGERVIQSLKVSKYNVPHEDYDNTLGVFIPDLETDKIGMYAPAVEYIGREASWFPHKLLGKAYANGDTEACFDGQPFFDTAHPVNGSDTTNGVYSNIDAGGGTKWVLLDDQHMLAPIFWWFRVEATPWILGADSEHAKKNRQILYGVDLSGAPIYGMPYLAFMSTQPMNEANLTTAWQALGGYVNENGDNRNVRARILLVGPSNEIPAKKLIENMLAAGGESNVFAGSLKVMMTHELP